MMRWAIVLGMLLGAGWVHAEDPLQVGGRRQLFIDQRFIAQNEGIELRMNPPQKLGHILDEQGNPRTEGGHISRVIEEQGKIRMYVGADSLRVLESTDGLRFRDLGVTIPGGELTTIFLDPHDADSGRRYKSFWVQMHTPFDRAIDGVYAAVSADGVQFTPVGRVLPFYIDNPMIVEWDARIGKYVIWTRAFDYGSENQRQIGRIETDDPLQPWPYTPREDDRERLSIHNVPVVLAADAEDNPHSDIYYNAATIYPWAQDVYLMLTAQFRHFSPDRNPALVPPKGQWEDFGLLEVQLATSRDGANWQRVSREPYVANGLVDEWDRWYGVMGPGIVRRGSYLYQYYYSTGRTHDSAYVRPEYDTTAPQMGGIGVVKQRLDGFISADADHRGGWLQTPPIVFEGDRLRLNIDTGAMGLAKVELRDANDQPLPGFTLADCQEMAGNYTDGEVHWAGGADVGALAGQTVRVRIQLIRAKLYAFQFGAAQ